MTNEDPNDISARPDETVKYFTWRGGARVKLMRGDVGLFRDHLGGIIAVTDTASTNDLIVRCGVGIASLPRHWEINVACGPHDYAYSSPAYQAFHLRSEADAMLGSDVYLIEKGQWGELEAAIAADALEEIARLLGYRFWENAKTND